MHTRIVVAVALAALAIGMGQRARAPLERHAQWGDPTKGNATPRPQVTAGPREQRNDAQRPEPVFGGFEK